MNEVKHYFYQAVGRAYGRENIVNWEILFARGNDGYYHGTIKGGTLSTQYAWVSTGKLDVEEAYEFLKQICDSRSIT